MRLENKKIGFAITGSFCTFSQLPDVMGQLMQEGADVLTILSSAVKSFDTRFGKAADLIENIKEITKREPIVDIVGAEPFGPKVLADVLVVFPCTGNTIAKLANAITDTSVTMACKAHLRNNRPVVLAVSTNDGLGANARNIGQLLNMKNIYMVPFGQDDPMKKPNSLVFQNALLIETILEALEGRQIQPILRTPE